MELLLAIFLAVLTVFVVMAFYHEHPKAKIPHGFSQRRKLYFFHYVLNFGFGLDHLLKWPKPGHLHKIQQHPTIELRYRLAPEHPYPTQFEDCLTATVHFMRTAQDYGVDPSRIIVCGDSSGGTLTAAVAQAVGNRRDLPKLRAQILIYPYLQCVDFNLPSYQQNEGVPVLLKERTLALGLKYLDKDLSVMEAILKGCHIPEDLQEKYQKWVSSDYIPHEFKTRGYKPSTTHPLFSKEVYTLVKPMFDPVFSPMLAEDSVIAQLPETFILTCEFDVLRDDGLLYKKRLEDHGIKVTWCHLEEGFHGTVFLALYGELIGFRSGSKGLAKIVNFLRLM
ncbi:arylacetamide deacetylase-like 4 [Limosa lapponica baueri]|uniref:Arylacetamide deacetylase-like 4 n=1 Tax=Limosa lapponica baueri TaxID=1758121 RepID=A0A2I0T5W6_LIMLA|nr:arylacetamide deacetylase-like 4 [Limosa lapponica baueri]